jgi:hypothetical protein
MRAADAKQEGWTARAGTLEMRLMGRVDAERKVADRSENEVWSAEGGRRQQEGEWV